jgi:KDO II ethanolaminephosphotransferase
MIPMIVWASDAYFGGNDETQRNLQANLDRKVSHDHLFHSVLDCAGIESPIVLKTMSLCHAME